MTLMSEAGMASTRTGFKVMSCPDAEVARVLELSGG